MLGKFDFMSISANISQKEQNVAYVSTVLRLIFRSRIFPVNRILNN